MQEIKGDSVVTPIPNTPGYIKGVMNLRGTIVPVVDLRARLAMAEAEYNQLTVIIVAKVGANGMARAGEKLVVLLDIDTVLGSEETLPLGSTN